MRCAGCWVAVGKYQAVKAEGRAWQRRRVALNNPVSLLGGCGARGEGFRGSRAEVEGWGCWCLTAPGKRKRRERSVRRNKTSSKSGWRAGRGNCKSPELKEKERFCSEHEQQTCQSSRGRQGRNVWLRKSVCKAAAEREGNKKRLESRCRGDFPDWPRRQGGGW